MTPVALYLAAIIGTNVSFSIAGPVFATFALAGLTLVLRDIVREHIGPWRALALIPLGAAVSALLGDPAVAVASLAAFMLAELLDTAIYEGIRSRSQAWGIAISGVVGSVVDSVVFLSLAFGSLAFLQPQITGKIAATLGAVLVLKTINAWRTRAA